MTQKVLAEAWAAGRRVVRLHTGDPSIFGAAASLNAELTLPEVAQTVITTRQEGQTPVPELEKLRFLAFHQTTILIFLSVSMMETMVSELIGGGYAENTPVAVVEKGTWEDENIILGTLADIADKVDHAGIRKTALICVGRVFADSDLQAVSKLYDKKFSHGTRDASAN